MKTKIIIALGFFCLLGGCGRGVDHASASSSELAPDPRKETLTVAREEGPNSLDIQGVGTNRPAYGTSWNLYDRLVTYGRKRTPDGLLMYDFQAIEPELAEHWEIDPGKHITFHLRKDATFHDGTAVTADDVKWSFDRALAIGGFPTFQMKAGSLESPEQFVVVDPHTFRVLMKRDDRLTLPDIGVPVAAIYNSKLAQQHATDKDPWAQTWLQVNAAGSGAFKVEVFEPGVQTVFLRNDAWKGGPMPKLRRVVERVVPSAATRRALLERGDLDVSFDLPPRDFADLAKNPAVKVQGVPIENFMWFIDMNVKHKPFDDVRVRRAIAAAVPYEDIFNSTCYRRGKPLYGASSTKPQNTEWPQAYPYHTDLERARTLLAEAGLDKGFAIKLHYNLGTATWSEPIALLVQQSLAKLGVQVTLEKVPAANWRSEMGKKSMAFLVNDMGGWLNYPEYFFFWNYHGQNAVFNTMSYQNPEMDALIEKARFTGDAEEYAQSVKGFLQKGFEDVPRIPLYQSNLDIALRPNVHGYHYWFHRQIDYRQMYKE